MHDTNAYMHTNVYVGLHELFHMYVYLDRCIRICACRLYTQCGNYDHNYEHSCVFKPVYSYMLVLIEYDNRLTRYWKNFGVTAVRMK